MTVRGFDEAWADKVAQGYRYGTDALEQVRFGWEIRDAEGPAATFEVSISPFASGRCGVRVLSASTMKFYVARSTDVAARAAKARTLRWLAEMAQHGEDLPPEVEALFSIVASSAATPLTGRWSAELRVHEGCARLVAAFAGAAARVEPRHTWDVADWAARSYAPTCLEIVGIVELADALRSQGPIADAASARPCLELLDVVGRARPDPLTEAAKAAYDVATAFFARTGCVAATSVTMVADPENAPMMQALRDMMFALTWTAAMEADRAAMDAAERSLRSSAVDLLERIGDGPPVGGRLADGGSP